MANSSYKSNDGDYTARDNTRVSSVSGYGLISNESKGPIPHKIDVTDGPIGYIPFLGDGLQAWQAKIDYDNGDVLSAGIGAGTLLMPPALSKFLRKTKPTWGPWVRKGLNYGMDKASSLSPRVRAFLDKYVSGLEGELSKVDVERVRKTVLDYQQRRDLEKAPLLPGIENDLPNYIEAKNIKVVPATNRENIINRLGLTETNSGLMRAGALNNGKRIVVFPGNANSEILGHEFRHSIQDEFDGSTLPVPVGNTNIAGFSIPKYDFLPLARLPLDTNPELDGVRSLLKQYNPDSSWHQKITELDAEVERARQRFHPNTTWRELYDRGDERLDKSLGFIRDRFHLQDNDEANYLMKTLYDNGYADGGKFIRAPKYNNGTARFMELLDDYASMLYQPYEPSVPEVRAPIRYEPQPHYGLYEYPISTGMAEGYPITTPGLVAAPAVTRPEEVVEDLFSEEAMARRALKQRYAESNFDNRAKSHAGAMGAWQIMPITYKDYLGRGRGKAGDLNDPEYNRKVRDWVMGIIPRDLQDLYSENDAPRVKLAKIYGAYNWGAGNMRKYLRKQREAGVDISNDTSWVEGLNPETKRYIKYLALDEDIPDSTTYTNAAFEKAATTKGLFREGGKKKDRKDFNPSLLKKAIVDVVGPGYYPNLVDVHGDFSRFYWGRPQKKDMLIDSPYYPTKSNNPDAKYYRVNDAPFLNDLVHLYNSSISHDLETHQVRPLLNVGDSAVLRGYDARNNSKRDSEYVGDTLERHLIRDGRAMGDKPIEGASVTNYPLTDSVGALGDFTVGRGNDERGDYLSYYDNWDLNGHTKITRAVEKYGLGKPYEIYDRIYGTFGENGEFHPLGEIEPSVISSEKASGGKIYIKPSHRGRLTGLKARTGKTEAELYNDGNPAHKRMVVFARNARKWHGDGGLLDKLGSVYGNDRARMLDVIRKIRTK